MSHIQVTPRELDEQAKIDPILATVMKFWWDGRLTWEQMLAMAVMELSKDYLARRAQLDRLMLTAPPVPVIKLEDPKR